jgi:peptide deformylase
LIPLAELLTYRAMALKPLVIIPDAQLRSKSAAVSKITPEIRKLVEDMFETMYDAPGIGLAAIQVGVPQRVVTMDLGKRRHEGDVVDDVEPEAAEDGEEAEEPEEEKNPRVFINPEITWSSDEMSSYEEGCLSIPDIHEEVERPARVKVKFMDLDGKHHEEEADGLYATCIQHEIDHLNGVLFIDHISKLKRDRIVKKFTKAKKRAED